MMRNSLNHGILLGCTVLLLACGSAWGTGATVAELLPRLDSPELAERDAALDELRRQLISSDGAQGDEGPAVIPVNKAIEQQIVEVLRTNTLSLEQRARLMGVMRERFMTSPRPAIGVQLAGVPGQTEGVRIDAVLAGYPAKEQGLIRAGDIVTGVGGRLLNPEPHRAPVAIQDVMRVQDRLRAFIFSHEPGDTVKLRVVRRLDVNEARAANPAEPDFGIGAGHMLITEGPGKNAEVLDIEVPLGTYAGRELALESTVLEDAWKARLERLVVPEFEVRSMRIKIGDELWLGHARPPSGLAPSGYLVPMQQVSGIRGDALAMADPAHAIPNQRFIQGQPVRVQGQMQLKNALRGPIQIVDPLKRNVKNQVVREGIAGQNLNTIMQRIAVLQNEREAQRQRSEDKSLPPAERLEAKNKIQALDAQANFLNEQLAELLQLETRRNKKPVEPQPE